MHWLEERAQNKSLLPSCCRNSIQRIFFWIDHFTKNFWNFHFVLAAFRRLLWSNYRKKMYDYLFTKAKAKRDDKRGFWLSCGTGSSQRSAGWKSVAVVEAHPCPFLSNYSMKRYIFPLIKSTFDIRMDNTVEWLFSFESSIQEWKQYCINESIGHYLGGTRWVFWL